MAAIAHVIVRHKELTGKSLVIEKLAHALGNTVKHAQLVNEVLGIGSLAVPLTAIALTEIGEIRIAVAGDIQKRPEGLLLILIEFGILLDALKRGIRPK